MRRLIEEQTAEILVELLELSPAHPVKECGKKTFASPRAAKNAHRRASFRIRAYWCQRCVGFHVTAVEKRRGE